MFDDDAAMSKQLVAEVTAAANEAISKKGSFLQPVETIFFTVRPVLPQLMLLFCLSPGGLGAASFDLLPCEPPRL